MLNNGLKAALVDFQSFNDPSSTQLKAVMMIHHHSFESSIEYIRILFYSYITEPSLPPPRPRGTRNPGVSLSYGGGFYVAQI